MTIESPRYDWLRRAARTFVQIAAGGGLYALTDQLAKDVPASWAPYVIIVYSVLVAAAQNYAEDAGWIPAVGKAVASSGAGPLPDSPAVNDLLDVPREQWGTERVRREREGGTVRATPKHEPGKWTPTG